MTSQPSRVLIEARLSNRCPAVKSETVVLDPIAFTAFKVVTH